MDEPHIVTAIFDLEPGFALTVKATGLGSGTVACKVGGGSAGPCALEYPEETELTLVATPKPGSEFVKWSGECDIVTGNECEVEMNEPKTVEVVFAREPGGESTPIPPVETCATNPALCPPAEEVGKAKAAPTASVKGGKAALKLSCSGGACKGSFKLTAKIKQGTKTKSMVIGKASFSLAAGQSKTIKAKLSAAAMKELGKGKTLKAKVTGTGIASSTVKLKPAKR